MTSKTRAMKSLGWSALAGLLLALPGAARAQSQAPVLAPVPEDDAVFIRHVGPLPPPLPEDPAMLPLGPPSYGIPARLVEKLNIPKELAQKVQDLTFQSNDALIPLEADLKRAQLQLERLLRATSPDENAILRQVEEVGRTETAVRKNRVSLMVQVKKVLGPDLWQKLEAEMGPVRVVVKKRLGGMPDDSEPVRAGPPQPPQPPQRRP